MAGTKNSALSERNRRICLLRRNGLTYGEIATMEQISRPRVAQIVAETMPELGEDEGRAELSGILEFVERKAVGLINDPGPLMGPAGTPARDTDGNQVPNNGIVVEGLKILTLVSEKKARLFAWDKPQPKQIQVTHELADQQKNAALAEAKARMELSAADRRELEALRQKAGPVIPGEVVRELES